MRIKLTAAIAVFACASAAAIAQAGPVPVAVYSFQSGGDVAAFQKQMGKACRKKWHQDKAMSIGVGKKTQRCAFDTSVVGDSTDPGSDMEMTASAALGGGGGKKIRNKAYIAVAVRSDATTGYELRVRPVAQKWQLFRDPPGDPPPALFRAGENRAIKANRPTPMMLRAFDLNTPATTVIAKIGKKTLISFSDSSADQPNGRRSAVAVGIKGKGAATGITGIFDNVAIRVPSPS